MEDNISYLIEEFRKRGDSICFTLDTAGGGLYGKVSANYLPSDYCFQKSTYGAASLVEFLTDKKYDEIYLCGVSLEVCVFANALICRSALPTSRVIIKKSACASPNEDKAQAAYELFSAFQIECE